MPIDFGKPAITDLYSSEFVPNIRNAINALGQLLDPAVAGTVTAPPTGTKRLNAGLFQQFNGTSWVSYALGYVSLTGDSMTGALSISRATAGSTVTIGDNSGTGAAISFDSGNSRDTSALWFRTNQRPYSILGGTSAGPAIKARWDSSTSDRWMEFGLYDNATGYSATMRLQEGYVGVGRNPSLNSRLELGGLLDLLRLYNDNGLISGYNSAGTTRLGYLQFNGGSNAVLLAAEGASVGLRFYVNSQDAIYIHPTRGDVILGALSGIFTASNRKLLELSGGADQLLALVPGSGSHKFYLQNLGTASGMVLSHETGPFTFNPSGTANIFQISSGGVYFGNNMWHKSWDGNSRFYFTINDRSYWAGGGNTGIQHQFRRGDGNDLAYMDSSGNFTAVANVTAYSDERLKRDFEPALLTLDQLLTLQPESFNRTDIDQRQVGVRAQSLKKVLPLAVRSDDEGILSVDYGVAAMVAVLSLAHEFSKTQEAA